MVKIGLQIRANLENIEELYTNHPNYSFLLKLKCQNCGELSDKWHDVMESQKFPTKMGKTEVHYLAKCKLCQRENTLDIIEGSNGKFTSNDANLYKTIVAFDCRGVEPVDFCPADGWMVKAEGSGKVFNNIDLTEKEWADYDDKAKQSVGIYEIESQFIKMK